MSFPNINTAGIIISVNMLGLTKPPIIGAATRVIISEPVPFINMIGSKPAMVEQVVIMTDPTRGMRLLKYMQMGNWMKMVFSRLKKCWPSMMKITCHRR